MTATGDSVLEPEVSAGDLVFLRHGKYFRKTRTELFNSYLPVGTCVLVVQVSVPFPNGAYYVHVLAPDGSLLRSACSSGYIL